MEAETLKEWWVIVHRRQALLAFLAGGILGLVLHFPAFVQPERFHENWRQSPHWTTPESQHFREDDLLIRYARFNTSPFANFMYTNLARTGLDIFWGKFNAVLFFALAVLSVFLAGRAMAGTRCGWIAATVFMFFPCIFVEFSGGFMSALSVCLLGFTMWLIFKRAWWLAIPLMALMALVYPMVAIQGGMVLLVETFLSKDEKVLAVSTWKRKVTPLFLAAVMAAGIVGAKYLRAPTEFGKLASWNEIRDLPQYTKEGRTHIVPVEPLMDVLLDYWVDAFHLALLLVVFLFLGKRMFRLPRGLLALFVATCVVYTLADIFLLRLYYPDRYVRRALPLFMALAAGLWFSRIFDDVRQPALVVERPLLSLRCAWSIVAACGLVVVGVWQYHGTYEIGQKTRRWDKHDTLYAFLRDLPGRPMIAMHPDRASDVPLLTGKSVLISREFAHPWWDKYWATTVERTHDFFRAYYAHDPEVVRDFILKYNIDYFVIDRDEFLDEYIQDKRNHLYDEPFDTWIREHLQPERRCLLRRVPGKFRIYSDSRFFVVSADGIMEWLGYGDTRDGKELAK